jgi:hypothetical protein
VWAASGAVRFPGALAGVAAALCYSSFLVAPLLGSRLDIVNSYVSEVETAGQPDSHFFRATSAAAGVLIVLFALRLRRLPDRSGWCRYGRLCLSLAGLASIVDSAIPMRCNPSANVACPGRPRVTSVPDELRDPHTLSSVVGVVAAVAAVLLIGTHLYRRRVWPPLGRAGQLVGLAFAGLAGLDVPLAFAGHGFGISERLHVLLFSGWLAALSLRLSRITPPTAPPAAGPSAGRRGRYRRARARTGA